MSWRAEVDAQSCVASGMCAALAPELFVLNDEHARPADPEFQPDELALDAADSCPGTAITVRDGDGRRIGPRD
ncbi:ferredoxin [Amycolatopsis cihanbeyliensis]|uniref:Ferredoxin n=1 Tax=Amycolatopsis cihanbeyliensis TaxID=1128664 RepID=A0A542CUS9_AMYCI|nr:ferredoxin [Amycolatopsis cihanbeyliensis]TQI94560.1 ferredoxin [Amycolatopsis cihanbeyliensis]